MNLLCILPIPSPCLCLDEPPHHLPLSGLQAQEVHPRRPGRYIYLMLLELGPKLELLLALQLAGRPQEVFAVLFLDGQHRLILWRELFQGTLTQTSVYPREVVKAALAHNAAAVILAHNHPSGVAEPSRADEYLTATLKSALALLDVRVLDHIVFGRGQTVSLAERGLL